MGKVTVMGTVTPAGADAGDADIAPVAALLAKPARARILMALSDGRSLPASVLASEAGVAASTASFHLTRLADAGLVTVRANGRHRYYALAGPGVGELIEALTRFAPPTPVRSLRQGTRARALRSARTCYDHLAGRLGVDLFAAMIGRGDVVGGDGRHDPERAATDHFAAHGHDVDYRLTEHGTRTLGEFGVAEVGAGAALRYCVDWSEQAHHLSGAVGRAVTARMLELGWIRRADRGRAVRLTGEGRAGLTERFGPADSWSGEVRP